MALHEKVLPPSLNAREAQPEHRRSRSTPVLREHGDEASEEWKTRNGTASAARAMSAFGFGGTNFPSRWSRSTCPGELTSKPYDGERAGDRRRTRDDGRERCSKPRCAARSSPSARVTVEALQGAPRGRSRVTPRPQGTRCRRSHRPTRGGGPARRPSAWPSTTMDARLPGSTRARSAPRRRWASSDEATRSGRRRPRPGASTAARGRRSREARVPLHGPGLPVPEHAPRALATPSRSCRRDLRRGGSRDGAPSSRSRSASHIFVDPKPTRLRSKQGGRGAAPDRDHAAGGPHRGHGAHAPARPPTESVPDLVMGHSPGRVRGARGRVGEPCRSRTPSLAVERRAAAR